MSATSKSILATPMATDDMVVPWGLSYEPAAYREPEHTTLAIPTFRKDVIRIERVTLTLESFYELREAVNDLYDHIRQETPTD